MAEIVWHIPEAEMLNLSRVITVPSLLSKQVVGKTIISFVRRLL